uniref:Uncharacterized protein n=1 Tax=Mucochytrium quahogii TaxID=96639 RepID=A0A7S2RYF0_9STRA|mmetsp:Transcript_7542/g.13765  ORF Transcript_7542/g.13765 Transcript_7542/m.13765 type:complete len:321 (-) Transcript_7542:1704-2666(-)
MQITMFQTFYTQNGQQMLFQGQMPIQQSQGWPVPTVAAPPIPQQRARKRRNLCLCEQLNCSSNGCRELEEQMGEEHWLNGSSFQLPPKGSRRCGMDIRARWLELLGVTEDMLEHNSLLKPEIRWSHFPEHFFKQEESSVPGRPRRRRLKYVVEPMHGMEDKDIIKSGKYRGMAIPLPIVNCKQALGKQQPAAFIYSTPTSPPMSTNNGLPDSMKRKYEPQEFSNAKRFQSMVPTTQQDNVACESSLAELEGVRVAQQQIRDLLSEIKSLRNEVTMLRQGAENEKARQESSRNENPEEAPDLSMICRFLDDDADQGKSTST